ncbi:hypothetical protein RFI_25282 [Reticulomyxa filosa]|uniref:ABC transporter domain-containing protein n=1 Tax=Reticulomyxa filosa TaxID=46433 RepID=X6MGB5_RETFI|nr:hypothetical protein RFI_25282 [Reticulomyxa filosa]|eukprot:ETO12095.1 hypothetical protein RFI_25282 [Reticulomyxa filosa]
MYMRVKLERSVAVVGESGSGKSTIMSLLLRYYDTDEGDVLLDGLRLKEVKPESIRSNIAVVSQEPVLFTGTIADNIIYGLEHYKHYKGSNVPLPHLFVRKQASTAISSSSAPPPSIQETYEFDTDALDKEIVRVAKEANAHDFIVQFPQKYNTFVGMQMPFLFLCEGGLNLSGGQKQRIAIARALIKNPKILLLDEATSALDAAGEALVSDALRKSMKGRTTIVIAHRLSTIRECDWIAVLKNGKIVEQGTHEELIADDKTYYSELVRRQLQA